MWWWRTQEACRQIAEARVKTDKKDIERLIRLLIADIVPEVWVPPVEVRELRGMISYRNRLVKTSTMIRNRLQSLIHRHNLILPKGMLRDKAWWEAQTGQCAGEDPNSAGTGTCWMRWRNTKRKWTRSWDDKAWEKCGANRR